MLLKYLGLTGQAKHNQMIKLEQPGSQLVMAFLDIFDYGIKAGERYSSTCSYCTTENSANREWQAMATTRDE